MSNIDKKSAIYGINKWFYFCNNYDYYFIEKIWGRDTLIGKHLRSKFDHKCDNMDDFYAKLDTENRRRLLDWVMDNYTDEIKIKDLFTND